MSSEIDISVIIPVKDRPLELERAIRALLCQTLLPLEIVVVDQTADDACEQAARRVFAETTGGLTRLAYHHEPGLSGLTEARNYGLSVAEGRLIVYSDDDAQLASDGLESFSRIFAEHQEIAGTACGTCHSDGHSPQRDLYVGIGGKGLQPRPSAMYLAGIHCEGCHFLPREKEVGFVQSASEVSCMACHGPRYSKMLDRWKNLLDERIDQGRRELTRVREKLGPAGNRQIADVQANLRLVEHGHGVHNIDYALDILQSNHIMLNAALQTAGHQPLPATLPPVPYESDCLRCHQGIEIRTGTFQGHAFAHRPHIVGQALDCQQCHRPHEERSPDEVVHLPAGGCISCHHASEQSPEDNCARCHSAITDALVDYQGDEFSHAYHVEDEGMECMDCHTLQKSPGLDLDFCVDCH